MLGTFEGRGEVKCPKTECGCMNIFNTSENCYQFTPKSRMVKNQQSGKERN